MVFYGIPGCKVWQFVTYTLKEKTNIQKNIKYKSTVLASCTWYSRMLVAPDSQSVLSERFAGFTSIFTFA